MSRRILFRAAARAEFTDAAEWYETQRPGLGDSFIAEVQNVIDVIGVHPERFPVVTGDVRVSLVQRFPYGVYFRIKPASIIVIAVFHSSRDPAVWQSRP